MYYIQFQRKWKADGWKKLLIEDIKAIQKFKRLNRRQQKNRIALFELQSCFVNANFAVI